MEITFAFLLLAILLIGAALVMRLLGLDRRAEDPEIDARKDR